MDGPLGTARRAVRCAPAARQSLRFSARLENMPTALGTGGSSGIGYAFATELARRGYDRVLGARDPQRLGSAARAVRNKFGVQVHELSADLSDHNDIARVAQFSTNRPLDLLPINSGSAAHYDPLIDYYPWQVRPLRLMIVALLALSVLGA